MDVWVVVIDCNYDFFYVLYPGEYTAVILVVRSSLFLGQCFKATSFAIFPLCPTFWGFVIAMIIWGIQSAIYNTVFESLLYDELVANNCGNRYTNILAKRRNFRTVGLLLSSAGSFFMFMGYNWLVACPWGWL